MALRVFIAASFFVVAGLCRAQGAAFSVGETSTGQALYRITLSTRAVSLAGYVKVGGTAVSFLAGLTFGPDSQLYAIGNLNGMAQPALLTLTPTTGFATVQSYIGGLSSSATSGLSLSFDCAGNLWMASADNNNFWQLTPGTGLTQLVGNLGVKITALAASGDVLYGIGGSGNANLYSIDTATGNATLIGAYGTSGAGAQIYPVDAGFDSSGTLWGLIRNYDATNLPTQPNTLVQINPVSGAMTAVSAIVNNPVVAGPPSYPVTFSGLAIVPPVCRDLSPISPAVSPGAPAISPIGLAALVLSMFAAGYFAFPPRQRKRWRTNAN